MAALGIVLDRVAAFKSFKRPFSTLFELPGRVGVAAPTRSVNEVPRRREDAGTVALTRSGALRGVFDWSDRAQPMTSDPLRTSANSAPNDVASPLHPFRNPPPGAEAPAISPTLLAKTMEENPNVVLVDLRPDRERGMARIPGDRSIPLSELPARIAEIPSGPPVVLYDHFGDAAARAAAWLKGKLGTPAVYLEGGDRRLRRVRFSRRGTLSGRSGTKTGHPAPASRHRLPRLLPG